MKQLHATVSTYFMALLLLVVAGCGGGDSDGLNQQAVASSAPIETVLRSAYYRAKGPAPESLSAIQQEKTTRALSNKAALLDPGAFFDWAELRFPQLFPGPQLTSGSGDLSFRFYAESELYLAVLGGEVLALGAPTANRVVSLGPLANYLCAVFPEVCEPPVAVVGLNQSVRAGALVMLDGSQSFDPSGDALSYQWVIGSKPAGSTAVLSSPTTAQTNLTPDLPGQYEVRLTVSDGDLVSNFATVVVTATLNNAPPLSVPGLPRSVSTGVAVNLDGTGSSDSDGDSLSFSWRFTSRPTGSGALLIGANTSRPTFTPDLAGQYAIELVVSDGKSLSNSASVIFTAANTNAPPTAVPGGSQSVSTGSVVFLNGRSSFDPNGDLLTYEWSFVTRPAGSIASLSSASAAAPTFTADSPGSYVVRLVVNDGKLNSAAALVTVNAVGTFVAPPKTCCKVCTTGKPCGASCISRTFTCRVGAGCAC